MKCLFSQQIASHTSYLHSFPTRRSSDLKVSAFAERHGLAHDANVVPGVQLEVLGFEHLGVAEMDIHLDRKSTRLNSSHRCISYAVFCLKKKIRTSLAV